MPLDRIQPIYCDTEVDGAGASTYGTDAVPALTDAFVVMNPEIKVDSTVINRKMRSQLLRPMHAGVVGQKSMSATFETFMAGYGGGAIDANTKFPAFHHLLQSCGFVGDFAVATWTYTMPDAGWGQLSSTIYAYKHGLLYKMVGTRGNAAWTFQAGQPCRAAWSMNSLFTAPAAAAETIPDYTTGTTGLIDSSPPICVGSVMDFTPYANTLSIGQFGLIDSVTIDLRNQVIPRMGTNFGSTDVSEWLITGHGTDDDDGILVSMDLEVPDMGAGEEAAWWNRFFAAAGPEIDRTVGDLNITVGAGAGKVMVWQLGGLAPLTIEDITLDGGRLGHRVTFKALGTDGSTGEDDLVITCT